MVAASEYEIRALAKGDKAELMKVLSDSFGMSTKFLAWKYDLNPDFDPSLVVVSVNRGQVVGGASWLPRRLKISESLSVRAALGADLAVHRNHRGRGLAKPLIASENTVLENKGIIMSYGLIDPKLAERVHGPLIGLVEIPTSTIVCKKYLNLSEIREKIVKIDKIAQSDKKIKTKLASSDMTVLFRFRGIPPFTIRIKADEIHLEDNDLEDADLRVECDLASSELLKSKSKTFTLIKALLTRKLRIKGSLRGAIKLYSLSDLLGMLFA